MISDGPQPILNITGYDEAGNLDLIIRDGKLMYVDCVTPPTFANELRYRIVNGTHYISCQIQGL